MKGNEMKRPKKTTKTKTKTTGTRRTGNRVSSIAGRAQFVLQDRDDGEELAQVFDAKGNIKTLTVGDVQAMAASLLVQDEHRGPRPNEHKGKRKP
jgi:hypothetical protein